MSYFSSGPLAQGDEFVTNLDDTWLTSRFEPTFLPDTSSTFIDVRLLASVDEGKTWTVLSGWSGGATSQITMTGRPVNAVKINVYSLDAGYTVSISFTGK